MQVITHPVVLALTGASGAPYGVRLLEVLATRKVPVWLIASSHGMRLLKEECGIDTIDEAAPGDRRRLELGRGFFPMKTGRPAGVRARNAPPGW